MAKKKKRTVHQRKTRSRKAAHPKPCLGCADTIASIKPPHTAAQCTFCGKWHRAA